MIKSYI